MAQFGYVAVDKQGKRVKGTLDAPSESEARVMLRSQSLRPLRLGRPSALDFDVGAIFGSGVKDEDVLLFTRQLSILVSSGVPLVQGLDAIATQATNPTMKKVVAAIKEKVTSGTFLWEALKPYKKIFPDLYIALVRAGEASGSLDTIFKRLMKYLEDSFKLKKLIKGAMIYPITITIVGIGVMVIMMTFVIPRFEVLLKSSGQELPGPTQFVLDLSHFFQEYILYMVAGIGSGIYLIKRYLATDEGRRFFDHWIVKLPIFGPILLKGALARFTRTMQTLLASGVNLLDAFDICREVIGNKTLADMMARIRTDVEQGKTFAGVIGKFPIFPTMMVQMITIGENTGNLDKMLERVADFYEEEIQQVVSNIGKLIEPFILVFLGGMVGGLMIAMYLPIFKMAGAN